MDGSEKDLDREELLALVRDLCAEVRELRAENDRLRRRVEELERQLAQQRGPTPRLEEAYSLAAEQRRREERDGRSKRRQQKSPRRGRIRTAEKLAQAGLHEHVLPDGRSLDECRLKYSRPVWRIIDGRAVRVAYHVYVGPDGRVPQIPGVPKRGEFGREILIAVAFQHYVVGLSLDKVVAQIEFFWELTLRKSQADALLDRLLQEWLPEFERLCQLLAVSAVVHADETSWSIHSVWAFLSEKARVTLFGCRKDAATLELLLKKDVFAGILVSDDATVYQGFSRAQKCWAHLLRKAIRLTLLKPQRPRYGRFLDALLEIYRRGKAIAADRRLSVAGRRTRVEELVNRICDCTGQRFTDSRAPGDEAEQEFINLTGEIVRLLGDDELFTFVIHPEADGTNNEAEQSLRGAALDRRTGRTSKTVPGARRRTVIGSVLDSLRVSLEKLTLRGVLEELRRYTPAGIDCFRRLAEACTLPAPTRAGAESLLARLIPAADSS